MKNLNSPKVHATSEDYEVLNQEIFKSRQVRGKGVKPALAHVNLRLPADVFEFYKSFPNCTGKMREVLCYFAQVTQQFEGGDKSSSNDR